MISKKSTKKEKTIKECNEKLEKTLQKRNIFEEVESTKSCWGKEICKRKVEKRTIGRNVENIHHMQRTTTIN